MIVAIIPIIKNRLCSFKNLYLSSNLYSAHIADEEKIITIPNIDNNTTSTNNL